MQCKAYFYGRGVIRFAGRRCECEEGHAGQHITYRSGLGAPFTYRWGRRSPFVSRALAQSLPPKVF